MITLERTSVMNMENAMRGARNPLNSWARGDSHINEQGEFVFGENDLQLAKRLCQAGNDHRKLSVRYLSRWISQHQSTGGRSTTPIR